MPGEADENAGKGRLVMGEAIGLAKDNGYYPALIDDLRSDPVAAQRAWVAANGPRANNNKTFFQIEPDAAANYLLKEINVNANLKI
jgi:hypothetical protein